MDATGLKSRLRIRIHGFVGEGSRHLARCAKFSKSGIAQIEVGGGILGLNRGVWIA